MPVHAAAIIPAGGIGRRMGLSLPKQFCRLAGDPLLIHVIRAFLQVPAIQTLVLVVPAAYLQRAQEMLRDYTLEARVQLVPGGRLRQDSVRAGLESLAPEVEIAVVHDGARPLVSPALITACLEAAQNHGAALAAVPVKDTLKAVSAKQTVTATVNREGLWQAQTPQAARVSLLRRAFETAAADGFAGTDESSLLERINCPVIVVAGSERNIKITSPEDLNMAEAILRSERKAGRTESRIGHGYDVHRLVDKRPLVLGGVTIPHSHGLLGHSDADVLVHALCDAILGACGQGDIGRHFPDTDPQFAGIASTRLLAQVVEIAAAGGFRLTNCDITVVAQQPKLAPFLPEMVQNLALICQVQPAKINIKATTTEHLGFAGRGEGIAAHAVAMLCRNQEAEV